MTKWERKLTITIGCVVAVIALGLCTKPARAATAQTQSRAPWTIGQCDRLTNWPARAVFNQSIWNRGGWPLWRVVCTYEREIS